MKSDIGGGGLQENEDSNTNLFAIIFGICGGLILCIAIVSIYIICLKNAKKKSQISATNIMNTQQTQQTETITHLTSNDALILETKTHNNTNDNNNSSDPNNSNNTAKNKKQVKITPGNHSHITITAGFLGDNNNKNKNKNKNKIKKKTKDKKKETPKDDRPLTNDNEMEPGQTIVQKVDTMSSIGGNKQLKSK